MWYVSHYNMLYEYGKRKRNVLGRVFKFYSRFLYFGGVLNKPVNVVQLVGYKKIINNSYRTRALGMIVKHSGHHRCISKLCHLAKLYLWISAHFQTTYCILPNKIKLSESLVSLVDNKYTPSALCVPLSWDCLNYRCMALDRTFYECIAGEWRVCFIGRGLLL